MMNTIDHAHCPTFSWMEHGRPEYVLAELQIQTSETRIHRIKLFIALVLG
jgi:hypothetical protein